MLEDIQEYALGSRTKKIIDHKNLTQDALGMMGDRVYRWRLLLEDYGPEIEYLSGHLNVEADAISCLDFNDTNHSKRVNVHRR